MIEEESGYRGKAEEFLQAFKKGAEFTHELLKENERLRFRVLELENALADHSAGDKFRTEFSSDEPHQGTGAGKTGYSGSYSPGRG